MNIAIVTTWFERGAAYVSKQIADSLISQDQKVFIYARGGEEFDCDSAPWSNYKVSRDRTPRLPMPTGMNKHQFKEFLRTKSIDLVIFNEQRHWEPILWANELGIPTAAYIDYYTPKTVPLFDAYDCLICNTQRHFEVFKNHRLCLYVRWGTDTSVFQPDVSSTSDSKFMFFHSAGMNPHRKGTDLVIQAADRLSALEIECTTLIHTQTAIERHFPHLSKTIESLSRKGVISIDHRTVTAPGLYHKGMVYLYPSRLDGIGLTVPEALSCGLPVITTDCPPMNEFVSTDRGDLIEIASKSTRSDNYYWPETTCSIEALASSMESYYSNPLKIKTQSNEARRYACENLDWIQNSSNLFHSISKLTAGKITETTRSEIYKEDNNSVKHYRHLQPLYSALYGTALSTKKLFKGK